MVVALAQGFWTPVTLLVLLGEVRLGKEGAGEQRTEYICCRSSKQKGLWILLRVHVLGPARWDNWRTVPTSIT